jgi:hypothetical protein
LLNTIPENRPVRIVEEEMADIPGQDAFLDVLTNMVGIIILLVVLMGLRASRHAAATLQPDSDAGASSTNQSFDALYRQAVDVENNVGDLMNQVLHVRREALVRDSERHQLTTYVAAFKQELDERRGKLSTEERRDFDLRTKLLAAQRALDDAAQEQVGLMSRAAEVEVIENKPTPIARRSTGRMLYIQLRDGHLAVLPFKEVENELANDFRSNLWRLRDAGSFTRTIGPFNGFRVRYAVERRTATTRVGASSELDQRGQVTALARFEFIPVDSPLGETVEEALQPGSDLQEHLRRFPPDSGVLAIMVFPDSLADLHRLKKKMYDAGYSIAEAPIPNGQWISFSTQGGYQLFAQ